MRNWFARLKLSRQLALVSCLFILVPTLLLWYTVLHSQRDSAIQTRAREAQNRCTLMVTQTERAASLCNMSSQVFLNTPALVEHLRLLKEGAGMGTEELLEFYRTDIASLEKIVLSNPNLYQIRVYAETDDMVEMIPILYRAQRVRRMPWAEQSQNTNWWCLDFDDQLFDDYSVTHHVMSLITTITAAQERVGVLEVAVRMDELIPDLFDGTQERWSVLLDEQGDVLVGQSEVDEEALAGIPFQEGTVEQSLNGRPVLVTQAYIQELSCSYLQVTDLSDIYRTTYRQGAWQFAIILAAAAAMLAAISLLTRRILRGFYGAFDGIRAFASGDTDATVTVDGQGEVADFAREADRLLEQIRRLMRDNLKREMDIQSAETRALQNQINAHFIYNVLEAIKMMAEIDEEYDIADAVTSLAKLLRYSMKLESGGVRLERELEYIKDYVVLMNLRFDYVIDLKIDVPPDLLPQRVPKISLQPIVENAVVHGAATLAADSTVTVKGALNRDQNRFSIAITDEGQGMDETALIRLRRQIAGEEVGQSSSGNGIGLRNVHNRIQMNFGPDYGLEVVSQPERGTTVIVTLPYREKEEETV